MTIPIEQREADYAAAEAAAMAEAEAWIERKAGGGRPGGKAEEKLDSAMLDLKRAKNRLEKAQRR